MMKQTGVMRVNCIDCLDRTNVAMSLLARSTFASQLECLGVLTQGEAAAMASADATCFPHIQVLVHLLHPHHLPFLLLLLSHSKHSPWLSHSLCISGALLLPVCTPLACINRAVLTCIETETLDSTATHCTKVCCIFNKEDQGLGWMARLPLWHRLSHGTLPHIIELLCGATLQCVYIHIHIYMYM